MRCSAREHIWWIYFFFLNVDSNRSPALILELHPCTISRELKRNRAPVWGQYNPVAAQRRAEARQQWTRPHRVSRLAFALRARELSAVETLKISIG